MLAKILVSDLQTWTFNEIRSQNDVTINTVKAPWENRKFFNHSVRGDTSGATHKMNEEVAEYDDVNDDTDNDDDGKEDANHIEVRSEIRS